jgi:hypothetical protein
VWLIGYKVIKHGLKILKFPVFEGSRLTAQGYKRFTSKKDLPELHESMAHYAEPAIPCQQLFASNAKCCLRATRGQGPARFRDVAADRQLGSACIGPLAGAAAARPAAAELEIDMPAAGGKDAFARIRGQLLGLDNQEIGTLCEGLPGHVDQSLHIEITHTGNHVLSTNGLHARIINTAVFRLLSD